jgi:ubiquinone/menaquinone biosynthesis C-methylase UbiE/uncharacterized protein YbaR (Trm112 family)
MNPDLLPYLICPECRSEKLDLGVYSSVGGLIEQGIIRCLSCNSWHRIEGGIIDLLPRSFASNPRKAAFAQRYSLVLDEQRPSRLEEQKIGQINFFAEGYEDYEEKVANSPYFKALDEVHFRSWIKRTLNPGTIVFDVGCGTGRQLIPLAESGSRVVGLDLSEEMLRLTRMKLKKIGLVKSVDLIVADAENIPLKSQSFDACVMVGTLHHVASPYCAIQSAASKIKAGGAFFSYDPHKSPLRFIFDWIMKAWKLYDEEASEAPLFTENELHDMLAAAGIKCEFVISTYMLPHLFYFISQPNNVRLLKTTDNIFGHIPFFRTLGGIIIADGTKEI